MRDTMKKCLAWVMTAFMLMTLMPVDALAATAPCPDGQHDWDKVGHDDYYTQDCNSPGTYELWCGTCGAHETVTITGHDWNYNDLAVHPTCTTEGFGVRWCGRCGLQGEYTKPALGHDWSEWKSIKEATCTTAGEQQHTCFRCQLTEKETVPALGHDFGSYQQTKAPTCTEKGKETSTCSRCGATQEKEVAALGHNFGAWTTTVAPTCMDKGKETSTCSRCGATQEREVAALGHDFGEWTYVYEPTCRMPGQQEMKCSRCGFAYLNSVRPLGHDMTEWAVKTKPAEGVDMVIEQHCTRGDYENTDTVPHELYVELVDMEEVTDGEGKVTSYILEFTITNNGKSDVAITDYVMEDGLDPKPNDKFLSVDEGADKLAPGATVHCKMEAVLDDFESALGFTRDFHVMGAQWYAGILYDAAENQFASNYTGMITAWNNEWLKPSLSVVKSVVSTPANGEYFVEGETIEYSITVTNNGNCDLESLYVFDEDIEGIVVMGIPMDLAQGESLPYSHHHEVTARDVELGFVVNVAFARADVVGGGAIVVKESNIVLSYAGDKKIGIIDDDPTWDPDPDHKGSFTGKTDGGTDGTDGGTDGTTGGTDGDTDGKKGGFSDGDDYGIDWDDLIKKLITGDKEGDGSTTGTSGGDDSTTGGTSGGDDSTTGGTSGGDDSTTGGNSGDDGSTSWEGSDIFKGGFGIEWDEYFKKGKETTIGKLSDGGFSIDWEKLSSSDRYGDLARESGKGCLRTLIPCANDHFEYSRDNCEYHTKIDEQAIQLSADGSLASWNKVKDLWKEELLKMYDLIHDATKNIALRVLISAEKETYLAQIESYEKTMNMVYATNPEIVAELMAGEYRNKVTDLCWMIHNMPENLEFQSKNTETATSNNTECRMILMEESAGHALYAIDTCGKHDEAGMDMYALLDNKATELDWKQLELTWEYNLFETMFGRYAAVYMSENKAVGAATKNDQNAYLEWVKNYMSLIGIFYQNEASAHKALALTFMERTIEVCGTTDGRVWIHKPDAEKPNPFSGEEVVMPEVTEVTEPAKAETSQAAENSETANSEVTPAETTQDAKKFPVAAVAGGGVGALAVIGGVAAFLMKKKKK